MTTVDGVRGDVRGGILAGGLDESISIANRIAPEHLQLAIENARESLPLVNCAGAIFLGTDTAEVVGDYTAGPSHVLPTSGTARFASPLGVYDFQVRSSVIERQLDRLQWPEVWEAHQVETVIAEEP